MRESVLRSCKGCPVARAVDQEERERRLEGLKKKKKPGAPAHCQRLGRARDWRGAGSHARVIGWVGGREGGARGGSVRLRSAGVEGGGAT